MRCAVVLWLLAVGCAPCGPLDGEEMFVAVARPGDAIARAALGTAAVPSLDPADQSFYLAVNKKALGERWFLSAFLKQYFPGSVSYGAARSLGTRVVTLWVQNDKLFRFDASDAKK